MLNIDLMNFFPSITENRVSGVLESLGTGSRVASIIARLCCHNNHLPQGAPTSPVLSNIDLLPPGQGVACLREGRALHLHAIRRRHHVLEPPAHGGAVRWAFPPSGRFPPDLLVPTLHNTFATNGFAINPDKAHYADRHSRRMVTGLKVNELLNAAFTLIIGETISKIAPFRSKDANALARTISAIDLTPIHTLTAA